VFKGSVIFFWGKNPPRWRILCAVSSFIGIHSVGVAFTNSTPKRSTSVIVVSILKRHSLSIRFYHCSVGEHFLFCFLFKFFSEVHLHFGLRFCQVKGARFKWMPLNSVWGGFAYFFCLPIEPVFFSHSFILQISIAGRRAIKILTQIRLLHKIEKLKVRR